MFSVFPQIGFVTVTHECLVVPVFCYPLTSDPSLNIEPCTIFLTFIDDSFTRILSCIKRLIKIPPKFVTKFHLTKSYHWQILGIEQMTGLYLNLSLPSAYTSTKPIFYRRLSKISANESRLYICNVFSYWLQSCSTIDTKWAQVSRN